MKRIRDTYGSARVYQNFSGTWKVELNLGGTLHYFNADTKEEAVEIANAQTNGGRVVIEDSKTRKSMKRVRDGKNKRGEYQFKNSNLIFCGVKKNLKGNNVFSFKFDDDDRIFSILAPNDHIYANGNADHFIESEVGSHFSTIDEMEKFFVNFIKKHGSEKQKANLEVYNNVSDSRKIKDAEGETPDVLDGILMIAFNDGSEEEGYNEVKKHANEQGELDGVQYETYDTDIQDGVTLIDLCAATDDANAFVKALLNEWGVIESVADIEFEKSELMENAEEGGEEEQVSDSLKTALAKGALKLLSSKIGKWAVKEVGKYLLEKGFEKLTGKSDDDKEVYESEDGDEIEVSYKDGKLDKVSDSKVEDMTKPAHLRGYAEKYRKKRREQKESYKENEEEKQDKEVSDSKTIKNNKDMRRVKDDVNDTILHFHIGRGGRFYNSNHLTYEGVYNKGLASFAFTHGATENDGYLIDEAGNYLGNAKADDEVGILDWDGEYDTDIFIYLTDVEYDDRYYGTILDCSDNYMESEVVEYVAQLFIDNELDSYYINNLPSFDEDDYEEKMDEIVNDICSDIKNDNVRDYIDTYIRSFVEE